MFHSYMLSNHSVSDGMISRGQHFSIIKKSVVTKEGSCYDTLQAAAILGDMLFHVNFELALIVILA